MNKKSTKKSSPPITAEVRPMMLQAIHDGMKVPRYFSDPTSKKRAADPINEITSANKTTTIMPEFRSLRRRFLRETSVSCTYSLRTAFTSLSNSSIISRKSGN